MAINDVQPRNSQSACFFPSSSSVIDVHVSSGDLLPLSDRNAWYYPSLGHDSDEEELGVGLPEGNWGHKNTKGARWVRRGKMTAWGPEMEDWEVEHSFPFHLLLSQTNSTHVSRLNRGLESE